MNTKILKTTRPAHYTQIEWLKAYVDKLLKRKSQQARTCSYWTCDYIYDYMKMRHRGEVARLEE